jgi:hypothetical protein
VVPLVKSRLLQEVEYKTGGEANRVFSDDRGTVVALTGLFVLTTWAVEVEQIKVIANKRLKFDLKDWLSICSNG